MLKYARHRAVENGKPMHFSQMNAEDMDFRRSFRPGFLYAAAS